MIDFCLLPSGLRQLYPDHEFIGEESVAVGRRRRSVIGSRRRRIIRSRMWNMSRNKCSAVEE